MRVVVACEKDQPRLAGDSTLPGPDLFRRHIRQPRGGVGETVRIIPEQLNSFAVEQALS